MDSYYDKDDSTLVQMTLLGDDAAFQELVVRYERTVQRTAYHVTGCRFSAEDAAQDAFVSAWMNLSALRESKKFKTWYAVLPKIMQECCKHITAAQFQISVWTNLKTLTFRILWRQMSFNIPICMKRLMH